MTEVRIYRGELLQPSCEWFEVDIITVCCSTRIAIAEQGDLKISATLLRTPGTDVVDHEPTKNTRRIGQEPRSIHCVIALLRGDLEIRLVKQRGRAERDVAARATKLSSGKLVEFVI